MGAPLAERLHRGFVATFDHMARSGAGIETAVHGDMTTYITGSPVAFFNIALATGEGATDEDLDAALDHLAAADVPYATQLRIGPDDDLIRAAEHRPDLMLNEEDPIPAMALTRRPSVTIPPELEIRRGPGTFGDHLDAAAAGFGLPRPLMDTFLKPEVLDDPAFEFYAGYVDGAVAGSVFTFDHDRSVHIYNVATLDGYRHRGFGSAMTARAVADGFDRGCDAAFLESSIIGLGVYLALGFERVLDYRQWRTRAAG